MLAKRIIPCLDCDLGVPGGRVVKGVEFKEIRYAGIPWELAERYYNEGADEIVFLDITASCDRRTTMIEVIEKTAENVYVPLTVGGGIRTLADAEKVFKAGADKVTVNTAALNRPEIISEISREYGNQACVVAIDAKRRSDGKKTWFECSTHGGRKFSGVNAIEWAKEAEERGAGDVMLTSMDKDGRKDGYDIELTRAISDAVRIPVIASGGCGEPAHILEVFRETKAGAALAASIFHYNEYSIDKVKRYLKDNGIHVRI